MNRLQATRLIPAALAAAFVAFTVTDTSNAAMVSVTADADTYVQGGSGVNNNYGSSEQLQVKNDGGSVSGLDRKIYIRFDVSGVSAPHATTPNAVLTLDVRTITNITGNHNFNVVGLNDGDAGENWGEGAITWNTAPQNNTGSITAFGAGTTSLGTLSIDPPISNGTPVTFSSAALDSFLLADTNGLITVMLSRQSPTSGSTNSTFHSKENTSSQDAPSLTFEVPTPAALPAGLTLVCLVFARRRR